MYLVMAPRTPDQAPRQEEPIYLALAPTRTPPKPRDRIKDKFGEVFTTDEEPFTIAERNRQELGRHQCQLPQNVFAASILFYMSAKNKEEGWSKTRRKIVPPLVLTVTLQCMFTFHLYRSVTSLDGGLEKTCKLDEYLAVKLVALFAFCSHGVMEFLQVRDIHRWLGRFEDVEEYTQLSFRRYKNNLGWAVHRPSEGTGLTKPDRSKMYRLLVVQILVTIAVLVAGSGAVLHADDRLDIVLNCVAATFVLQIDDFTYELFISRGNKNLTENFPPLNAGYYEWEGKRGKDHSLEHWFDQNHFWLIFSAVACVEMLCLVKWC